MSRKHRLLAVMATVAVAAVGLTACSTPSSSSTASSSNYVSGGTFTVAVNDDPGSLSPLTGVSLVQRGLVPFGYESMVYTTSAGKTIPWMAKSWTQTGTTVTFTLKPGITCADGSAFTAATVVNNIAYQANSKNGTFWFGSSITEGMTASASGDDVTITSPTNNPFLLQGVGSVEMVCQAGLDDPTTLTDATNGTALYKLSSSTAGSDYIYSKRSGYTWGPDGVTSKTKGLPSKIDAKVVTDTATAANLLLSGELNAASIIGSDQQRLDAAKLKTVGVLNPIGEMLFNERADRPTSDVRVRQALELGLNRKSIAELVTDGKSVPVTSLVNKTPLLCVAGGPKWKIASTDLDKAGELLDEAGYTKGTDGTRSKDGKPLTIRFIYDAGTPSHAAAAEEVQQEWNALGITTKLVAEDPTGWSTDLYTSYDWDTGFIQLAPESPVTLSLFFLGKTSENGGYNFMDVQNPEYNALATQAQTASDATTACGLWQSAEAELVNRADVYPLAQTESLTYLKGATLDMPGGIQPTSIRMLG